MSTEVEGQKERKETQQEWLELGMVMGDYPPKFMGWLSDQALNVLGARLREKGMEAEAQLLNDATYLGTAALRKMMRPLRGVEVRIVMETVPALARQMEEMGYTYKYE